MPSIFITGASSGFGLETARLFLDRGWEVHASMRRPDATLLPASDRLHLPALDVTDPDSIAAAAAGAGAVDVLVNNAGIGLAGVVEATDMATVRELFEVNTLGTIAMTRAFLPAMREAGAGTIVNVSSSVTLKSLPMLSVYTATKSAVNAFTDCLALELAGQGIRVGCVLPGASDTRFTDGARGRMPAEMPEAYAGFIEETVAGLMAMERETLPGDVAGAIWQMATEADIPARLPAGADAEAWFAAA